MNPNRAQPKLTILNQELIRSLHKYSLRILQKTGIKVESETARKIFQKSAGVQCQGDIVFIEPELVQESINSAPSNINVYNKSGDIAFNLGEKQTNTLFGIGVTNTNFQNILSDDIEPFTRKHMRESTRLGDMLAHVDMISTLGIPSDAKVEQLDLFSTLDMYANTHKPLVLLISEGSNTDKVFDLLEYLHGDISNRPFCIPYVNPITPLVLNKATSDKMIATISRGLPLMYSNYCMYGGTTPMSEGGSLALLNAELLAGLVFSQLLKPGAEMILGSLPAAFNMKTMGSQYTPVTYVLNLAIAEMMDFYKIPHCGTSGSNNGWGPDILASADLWQNHLSSCLGKVGCAPFTGGNFDSMAFSPSTVVLSDYIIGEVKEFAKGFEINEEQVNLNEIHRVSHGGNYFTSDQTLEALGNPKIQHEIWPSYSLENWINNDKPSAEKLLKEYTQNLYDQASASAEKDIEIVRKGEEYIAKTSK